MGFHLDKHQYILFLFLYISPRTRVNNTPAPAHLMRISAEETAARSAIGIVVWEGRRAGCFLQCGFKKRGRVLAMDADEGTFSLRLIPVVFVH